jgi:hypothetical protein
MRNRTLSITICLVLGACGATATAGDGNARREPSVPDVTLIRTESGVVGVTTGTDTVRWTGTAAVAAADGSAVFGRAPTGELVRLDPVTGAITTRWPMPAGLTPVLVEPGGGRVVLSERPLDFDSWTTARASTRLVVFDAKSGTGAPIDVDGDFEPEAFGAYPTSLFGLAHTADHYRVVVLDTVTGARSDVSDSDKEPAVDMRGHPIHGVLDAGRTRLSTLYVNPEDTDEPAFVHVLDLRGWSYCVDLPEEFASGPARSQSIEITPDDVLVVRAPAVDRHATFDLHSLDVGALGGPQPAVVVSGAGVPADAPYRSIPGFLAVVR